MFGESQVKRMRVSTPPIAHSSSNIKRSTPNFKTPLDFSTSTHHHNNNNSTAAALDLLTLSKLSHHNQDNALNMALAGITSPPAVPPPSSKFWNQPPPNLNLLVPPACSATATPTSSSKTTCSISSLSAASASESQFEAATSTTTSPLQLQHSNSQVSKYTQLLLVLEEMGKDIRPSYAGSKSSVERLKRGIVQARLLVREALQEADRAAK